MSEDSGRPDAALQRDPGAALTRARRQWRVVAWLAVACVAGLSLTPLDMPVPPQLLDVDKLVHVGMYASLMLCFSYGYPRRHWAACASGLTCYGVLLEFLQGQTAYRSASGMDALANLAGVSIMLWLRVRRDNQLRRGARLP